MSLCWRAIFEFWVASPSVHVLPLVHLYTTTKLEAGGCLSCRAQCAEQERSLSYNLILIIFIKCAHELGQQAKLRALDLRFAILPEKRIATLCKQRQTFSRDRQQIATLTKSFCWIDWAYNDCTNCINILHRKIVFKITITSILLISRVLY